MKGIVIIANIFTLILLILNILKQVGFPGSYLEKTTPLILLSIITVINLYYIIENKKGRVDDLFKKKILKKNKVLKIILIPIVIFFILVTLSSSQFRDQWVFLYQQIKTPIIYSPGWTGIYTSRENERICDIKRDIKTEEECIVWGENKYNEYSKADGKYKCGKGCSISSNCTGSCPE